MHDKESLLCEEVKDIVSEIKEEYAEDEEWEEEEDEEDEEEFDDEEEN